MMVTFVSQCEKNALKKTRRVLDAFADRIGDNTWQTLITEDGLLTVKKMLRQTASKSTAVSCHWIRTRARSQFLWVVGNRRKFNELGVVPVNTTLKEISKENLLSNNTEVIALLSGLAGFFHDFGKANILFQKKLSPDANGKTFEPYRHEWVSLRLFQAFVDDQTDRQWLQALVDVNNQSEKRVLKNLEGLKDGLDEGNEYSNPFTVLPPVAKLVAWLIVSHHKLPVYPESRTKPDQFTVSPSFDFMDQWVELFKPEWNSPNFAGERDKERETLKPWDKKLLLRNWSFGNEGTPLNSVLWQKKASQLAKKALNTPNLFEVNWPHQRFTAHMARMALMLSDHYYSSLSITDEEWLENKDDWQDPNYTAIANTDRNTGEKKQHLDEHNIGVGLNAYELMKELPKLLDDLRSLPSNMKEFTQTVEAQFSEAEMNTEQVKNIIRNFKWQDLASDAAKKLQPNTKNYGFFGINMASTGKGKTRSNARIMYALANEKHGCRFSVALGLRALTLQTGEALAKHLNIKKDEDLAVLIGSQAVKQLYEMTTGSESEKPLAADTEEVIYKGEKFEGNFSKWIKHDKKIDRLLQAPVLVSTIDYLIPATEGTRGGRQIAPMLRLLTSDLVLDEPDDLGLDDLPALCRLVNWAGMLGSKVLLSTATMPPALAYALFQAYQAGRKEYTRSNWEIGGTNKVCCAWFDEFGTSKIKDAIIDNDQSFKELHTKFVDQRIKELKKENSILRKADLLPISCDTGGDAIQTVAEVTQLAIHSLHDNHHQTHVSGTHVSIGLVRMANINPLVAVAKRLLSMPPQKNYCIHYCIYHSQYPLAIRSHIENKLDAALNRQNEEEIWLQEEIGQAVKERPELNHVFVVLATSVAEVGRDHDYDWAIAEPSSMRSLIQLAGRIQRHRKKSPKTANLLILSKNIRALKDLKDKSGNPIPAYCKPGFEKSVIKRTDSKPDSARQFFSRDLKDLLLPAQYQHICAIPRIKKLGGKPVLENRKYCNFVELEQIALHQQLLGAGEAENKASYWWLNDPAWNGELQRRQPFRRSAKDSEYSRFYDEDNNSLIWKKLKKVKQIQSWYPFDGIEPQTIEVNEGNEFWLNLDIKTIYPQLADKLKIEMEQVNKQFGVVRLREDDKKVIRWCYHENLGVFNDL
jgi:CRISPR-associated endonuclease/helicase Cas3